MGVEIFRKNKSNWQYIAIGLIILLAAILRLWNLGSESAWIDEAYSITLARHSILDILKGTAADQHPPLYYLLLKFWLLFGSGVTYARFLSVIIGVINVGQVLHFGYRTAGIAIGILAGLLVAISPMHVWYSQEIRMYILLVSLTTASTAALWWALKDNKLWQWSAYCLFSILSLYTQYFAAFIFFAQGVWILIWVWRERQFNKLWYW
ncbi:MAG: glycosyltransferase family 39 protein, partial [Anaerolineales bacterium]